METRARWLALLVGAEYIVIGALGWMLQDPSAGSATTNQLIVLGLWAAVGILALGIARPDVFQITTREVGPWLGFALAAPLALLSLRGEAPMVLVLLWPLSVVPLGICLGGSPDRPDATWAIAGMFAALAIMVGVPTYVGGEPTVDLATVHAGVLTLIALGPALIAARRSPGRDSIQAGRVLIGLAPLAGAMVLAAPAVGLVVLAAALLIIALVNRMALRPLAGAAVRATIQRDIAVAAVEAERRKLAADIHDGPLQSLLLLGRHLEQQGHRDAASSARVIADELRDVAGELRLPLLDDLGVGPALDWLADRARRMSGAPVSVTYEGMRRPPRDVELAAFRIAQEAVANAIRHGEPPIVIRYRTTGDRLSLSVTDAGRGFRTAAAGGSGSHGLLNMAQRAEQIGARLELLHEPTQGMFVGIEWSAAG